MVPIINNADKTTSAATVGNPYVIGLSVDVDVFDRLVACDGVLDSAEPLLLGVAWDFAAADIFEVAVW